MAALAFLTFASASTSSFDLAAALAEQVNRIPGLALRDLSHSAATLISPGAEQSVDAKRLAPCVASAPAGLAACLGGAGGQGVALVVDEGRAPTAVQVLSVLPPRALLVILLGGSAARLAEVQHLLDVLNAQFLSPHSRAQLARQIGLLQIGANNAVAGLNVTSCPAAEPLPPGPSPSPSPRPQPKPWPDPTPTPNQVEAVSCVPHACFVQRGLLSPLSRAAELSRP